jgi:predicted MFS family arabinose efflux permease
VTERGREKFNVFLLAVCQMLFGSGRTLMIATTPVIAYTFAAEKALATLPTALVIVGTAISTFPASMYMGRAGRKAGFLLGLAIGAVGGLVCMAAVIYGDFWLLCLGNLLFGAFAGFAQHYRFAAADTASMEFRSTAISLVLAGGVLASLTGAELAKFGRDLIASDEFLGVYVFLVATMLLSAAVLMLLKIPGLTPTQAAETRRPLSEIMRQPAFVVATTAATIGQGTMNLLMTAAPIAMVYQCGLSFDESAFVIAWHGVGMFAPAFFTGNLIKRFGEVRIITMGFVIQIACIGIALSGIGVTEFWLAMFLLGVGWNFSFTGGSSLVLQVHNAAERAKTQGAMNFLIFFFVAIGTLSSGALLHYLSWEWLNIVALPLIVAAIAATLWFGAAQRRSGMSAA